MNPTLVKDRTHCPKGHDLRIHGYYFGGNQRCRVCNRRRVKVGHSELKNQVSEERATNVPCTGKSQVGDGFPNDTAVSGTLRLCCRYLQRLTNELLPSMPSCLTGLETHQDELCRWRCDGKRARLSLGSVIC
jgi:hypothetical protein